MKPKIVPFKHRVAYQSAVRGKKTFYKTHDHFKVMFGRKSAGIFWSEKQARDWIGTFGSEDSIRQYFKLRLETAEHNLKNAKDAIKWCKEELHNSLDQLEYLKRKK